MYSRCESTLKLQRNCKAIEKKRKWWEFHMKSHNQNRMRICSSIALKILEILSCAFRAELDIDLMINVLLQRKRETK